MRSTQFIGLHKQANDWLRENKSKLGVSSEDIKQEHKRVIKDSNEYVESFRDKYDLVNLGGGWDGDVYDPATECTVTLTINDNPPGTGSLGGDVDITTVAGVATFTDVYVTREGSGYTLKATATAGTCGSIGVSTAISAPFNKIRSAYETGDFLFMQRH